MLRIDSVNPPFWFATDEDGTPVYADGCFVDEVDGEDTFLGYRECAANTVEQNGHIRPTAAAQNTADAAE